MRIYTIRGGDTLSGIAERELGKASRWPDLWKINRERIEAEQRRRLGPSRVRRGWTLPTIEMSGPNWIFPGTEIMLPE